MKLLGLGSSFGGNVVLSISKTGVTFVDGVRWTLEQVERHIGLCGRSNGWMKAVKSEGKREKANQRRNGS